MIKTILASAVMAATLVTLGGCGSSTDTTTSSSTTPPTTTQPTVGERVVEGADKAVAKTKDAMGMDNNGATPAAGMTGTNGDTSAGATTQPGNSAASNLPGLPTINGTSTKGLSTADAAAQRLIEAARNDIAKNDPSGAKKLVDELKQPGMYNSLSPTLQSQVDQLATSVGAASTTQPQ